MAEPQLVADCIKAMQDAVSVPVTVKHRIGIDRSEDYEMVRDFVGALYLAGCRVFIVHARNAWLKGLSPRENREVPPLRYEVVQRLKRDFADAVLVLNGGLQTLDEALQQSRGLDGVMLGRAAYQHPYLLADVDTRCFGESRPQPTRVQVVARMRPYLERECHAGAAPRHIVRHMLGLWQGRHNARRWRRLLSDAAYLEQHGAAVLEHALAELGVAEADARAAA